MRLPQARLYSWDDRLMYGIHEGVCVIVSSTRPCLQRLEFSPEVCTPNKWSLGGLGISPTSFLHQLPLPIVPLLTSGTCRPDFLRT